MATLCDESSCPACGAQCDRKLDHEGQHSCINCGTRWNGEEIMSDKTQHPVEMTCNICQRKELVEGMIGHWDGEKMVGTGICPACREEDLGPIQCEVRKGIDGEDELYAPDPIDGHNVLNDLPNIEEVN